MPTFACAPSRGLGKQALFLAPRSKNRVLARRLLLQRAHAVRRALLCSRRAREYHGRMRIWATVGVLVGMTGVAQAQYRNPYNNMTWNNSFSRMMDMTNSMNQSLMSQMNRINLSRSLANKALSGETQAAPAPAPKAAHKPLSATDFKPADKGHPVIDRFVSGFPQLEPADRAGLKQALEQTVKNF